MQRIDLDAFVEYARGNGAPETKIGSYRKGAQRILDLAGEVQVLPKHVDQALMQAEKGGAKPEGLALLKRIGDLLVEFSRGNQGNPATDPISPMRAKTDLARQTPAAQDILPADSKPQFLRVKSLLPMVGGVCCLVAITVGVTLLVDGRDPVRHSEAVIAAASSTTPLSVAPRRLILEDMQLTLTLPAGWNYEPSEDRSFQVGGQTVERGATFFRGASVQSAELVLGATIVAAPPSGSRHPVTPSSTNEELLVWGREWLRDYGTNFIKRNIRWTCSDEAIVHVGFLRAVRCRGFKQDTKQTGYLFPIAFRMGFFQLRGATLDESAERQAEAIIASIER